MNFSRTRALRRAIAVCGSQAELARRMNVHAQAIAYYLRAGVPPHRVAAVVEATKGIVTAAELRPDLASTFEARP